MSKGTRYFIDYQRCDSINYYRDIEIRVCQSSDDEAETSSRPRLLLTPACCVVPRCVLRYHQTATTRSPTSFFNSHTTPPSPGKYRGGMVPDEIHRQRRSTPFPSRRLARTPLASCSKSAMSTLNISDRRSSMISLHSNDFSRIGGSLSSGSG
ncbi:uncharacterized protein A4U43_C01F30410 [Asparagus officinalis]|uniref:Uncharacterized protein n=1 Tax=Asparagus officinalis TaxID=4686 RepID=A0A5P1FWY6_ASPOF|nr:uncharacterized protein A4U43_C01F30410 [Asparagus officinalis]